MTAGYLPLFLINLLHPPPPDSRIPQRDLISSTQTMKEAKLEMGRIELLLCPRLLFQTSSMRQLPLSPSPCPSSSPSSLSPEMRDTSNFTPSLLFRLLASSSVALTVWQAPSQRLRKFLILPRSWLLHSYSSVHPQFLPLLLSDICFLSLKRGKAFDSSNQRTEQTKQKQFRGADEKLLLCHTGSSFRNKVRTCFEHQLTISYKHFEGLC